MLCKACIMPASPFPPGKSLNSGSREDPKILVELAADGAGDGEAGVHVGEEGLGVLLDAGDAEPLARVLTVGAEDARHEGAPDAADAGADAVALGVGEGDANNESQYRVDLASPKLRLFFFLGKGAEGGFLPRRTGFTLGSLVNMRGRQRGALVLAPEAGEGDVVADDVVAGVYPEPEEAGGALEPPRRLVLRVDDLAGFGDDLVGRGEAEGALALA